MTRKYIPVESAKNSLRVALAYAAAVGLITGIDEAAEEGHPLSQLQKIHMAEMMMMAVASTQSEHEATLSFESDLLGTLAPRKP